ncbi:MAG: hypothetical protein DWI24_06870 [Planctomycetota bacterium]|nr:MAG: hypothetical protein DWI24_06870 [Planctomycetota bacterium]
MIRRFPLTNINLPYIIVIINRQPSCGIRNLNRRIGQARTDSHLPAIQSRNRPFQFLTEPGVLAP